MAPSRTSRTHRLLNTWPHSSSSNSKPTPPMVSRRRHSATDPSLYLLRILCSSNTLTSPSPSPSPSACRLRPCRDSPRQLTCSPRRSPPRQPWARPRCRSPTAHSRRPRFRNSSLSCTIRSRLAVAHRRGPMANFWRRKGCSMAPRPKWLGMGLGRGPSATGHTHSRRPRSNTRICTTSAAVRPNSRPSPASPSSCRRIRYNRDTDRT